MLARVAMLAALEKVSTFRPGAVMLAMSLPLASCTTPVRSLPAGSV